jgi:hypothetical protein
MKSFVNYRPQIKIGLALLAVATVVTTLAIFTYLGTAREGAPPFYPCSVPE